MNSISRRDAICRIGALAASAALAPACATFKRITANARPNILFIYTDDQRWDAMSCMGHPFLKTPNMDRLANEGLRFENAFVTIALCGPSRAAFLTGTHPHINGVIDNFPRDPDPSLTTYPQALQKAGYETAYVGKWHMDSTAKPRPGFDYWLSFVGQGEYDNPPLNENGRDFQANGYMTDLLTDYAVNWLKQPRDKPFCLTLAHKAVHMPFTPADRHKDLYKDDILPKPVAYDDDLSTKPLWQRSAAVRGIFDQQIEANKDLPVPDRVIPEPWTGLRNYQNYWMTIQAVDDSIGALYKTLEGLGVLDNTIIIFSSDNGYFMGEHPVRSDKRIAYEESIRIPMLVRYPKLIPPRTTRPEMVLNIDLAPTLLELAGAPTPASMQGMSWLPLLKGQEMAWRQSFLYQYFVEKGLSGLPTVQAVRTARWKYATYPEITDIDELYDLDNDPHEMVNLAQDPKYKDVLEEMKRELVKVKQQAKCS